MDDVELKNIIKSQKIPMDLAVNKKLSYLKSDEVFQTDKQEYLGASYKPKFETDNTTSIQEAFETLQMGITPSVNTSSQIQQAQQIQQTQQPNNNQPMSMAQRILALRGAMSMSSNCAQYQKKPG